MPRERVQPNWMPCYGCNGTGKIGKGKYAVTCTSCGGRGGWPKK